MSADSEIYAKLSTTAGVTNLCSTRIYPLVAAQEKVKPFIVYECVVSTPVPHASGQVGFQHNTYSIDCVDDDHAGAVALGAAVKAALEGYTATAITCCSHRNDTEEWYPGGDATDSGAYVVVQEWYVRTVG